MVNKDEVNKYLIIFYGCLLSDSYFDGHSLVLNKA